MKRLLLVFTWWALLAPLPVAACEGYLLPEFARRHIEAEALDYTVPEGHFPFGGEPIAQLDCSVVADLNGDGQDDFTGLFISPGQAVSLLAIYSGAEGYRHTVLEEGPWMHEGTLWQYLRLQPPGKVNTLGGSVTLPHPGVHAILIEKSATLYYWCDDGFCYADTGD